MRTMILTILSVMALAGTFVFGQSPAAARVYTYGVKLTASGAYSDRYSKESFRSTANWEGLVIKLTEMPPAGVIVETVQKPAGRIDGVWHYEEGQKCIGDSPFSSSTATAEIAGFHSNSNAGSSTINFGGRDDELRPPEDECPNSTFVNLWSRGSLVKKNTDGLDVVSEGPRGAGFLRTGGPGFFFPLDSLRDGKGFTVKGSDTITNPDYTYTWELELIFTPAPTTQPPDTKLPRGSCALYDKKRCEDLRKATWEYDDVLRNLNRLPVSEVVAKTTELLKLIDELKPQCEVLKYADELAAIKRDLEDWMRKHKNVQPRLSQSRTEGKAIWDRLYSVTEKICKPCCGGIGSPPPFTKNPR